MAITPNGRPGDKSPLARPGYTGPRRTSDYEREIAHALIRKGYPKGKAIGMARGLLRKAAATGRWGDHGKAGARTRAGAAASIAQRKTFSLSNSYLDEPRLPDGRWKGFGSLHPTEAAIMDAEKALRDASATGVHHRIKKAKRRLAFANVQRAKYLATPEGKASLVDPNRPAEKVSYLQALLRRSA